jgi:hypothetical protein
MPCSLHAALTFLFDLFLLSLNFSQVNLLLSNAFLVRHFPKTFNQELQGLQIQKLLTAIVIIAFLSFALVSRPFLDTQEDFMDITCRVVNM